MELSILNAIQQFRTPFLDHVMCFFSMLGNAGMIWIILALLLVASSKKRKTGVMILVGLVIEVLVCNLVLKNMIARPRPCDINLSIQLLVSRPSDYSFPSGHTAASFTAVAVLFFMHEKKLFPISLLLGICIAFSRMYLYVHYPTDILGGILTGMICGRLSCMIVERMCSNQCLSQKIHIL